MISDNSIWSGAEQMQLVFFGHGLVWVNFSRRHYMLASCYSRSQLPYGHHFLPRLFFISGEDEKKCKFRAPPPRFTSILSQNFHLTDKLCGSVGNILCEMFVYITGNILIVYKYKPVPPGVYSETV